MGSNESKVIEYHSSLKKRKCNETNQIVANQTIKSALSYDILNHAEKELCERYNILPNDYLSLKVKIVRE